MLYYLQYGERSQVVKAADCGSAIRGFESHRSPSSQELINLGLAKFGLTSADRLFSFKLDRSHNLVTLIYASDFSTLGMILFNYAIYVC